MTLQINDRPFVAITLLPMTDDSHELLRQLLTQAERPTIAPSQQVVRFNRYQDNSTSKNRYKTKARKLPNTSKRGKLIG